MTVHPHDHPDFLAHHWDTPRQQFEAGKLGMWLFLATEVLLFGGLFVGYAVWRSNHPDMFRYGSQFLDTRMGAINTAVLIVSSLTMAGAVTAAQRSKRGLLVILLTLTLAGAATFMVIKYFEYTHKFHEGWYPGMRFYEKPGEHSHSWSDMPTPETVHVAVTATEVPAALPALPPAEPSTVAPAAVGPTGLDVTILEETEFDHGDGDHIIHPLQDPQRPDNAHMFFNIYFMMTGLHGIHVIAGGFMLIWLLLGTLLPVGSPIRGVLFLHRAPFNAEYFTPVDLGGLYWHIVDLIWIFLFPLFYLI